MCGSDSSGAISELGEDRLLAEIFPALPPGGGLLVGPGDDAAVLAPFASGREMLFKIDSMVERVHFLPDTPAELVGRKALARAISDMAAMGGRPAQALVSLALPRHTMKGWVSRFYDGMSALAGRFEVGICGGELSKIDGPVVISVALLGSVPAGRAVGRSGGRAGDLLFVTGELGGSFDRHHLSFVPRVDEAEWLVEHARPAAMMDLSDGLAKDLPRLARASGTGFWIDRDALPCRDGCGPRQALDDGEDFELLFAIPPERERALNGWAEAFPHVKLTRIGQLVDENVGMSFEENGYDHFSKR